MSTQRWTADNIPHQDGTVAIVTGSTSGLGEQTARVLAQKGATVVMAVRNISKGSQVADGIRRKVPSADLHVLELDLADLASVRQFAATFPDQFDRLDLLVNNAGVMIPPYTKTADGFELQMGTNHFGHFALTGLLLPVLRRTENSRVVVVSSFAHQAGNINFEDLHWEKRDYRANRAYGDSKLANLLFVKELTRRLREHSNHPLVIAAHPGWTVSELQRHSGAFSFMNRFFAQDVQMGTLPTLRAAFDETASAGEYFGPDGIMQMRGYPVRQNSNKRSRDGEAARRLWDISEELTGVTYDLAPTDTSR